MKATSKIIILAAAAVVATSCVSSKKYNQLNGQYMRSEDQNARIVKTNENLQSEIDRITEEKRILTENLNKLQGDYKRLLTDNSAEATRMLAEIEKTQSELAARERALSDLERAMNDLDAKLRSRDEALAAIRRKVADALLGFEGKGLTISQRDGNVYVSMDDKLLFKSGSFDIDPKGAEAVRELSNVLAQSPEINVMVEGHTDNVPYKGSAGGILKDNLDLSVKRATTVTRLILENGSIDASRITSAGRGEWLPLDTANTPEARQKNRRTEIILTPKISELLQIVE